jgi:hypothetical protein
LFDAAQTQRIDLEDLLNMALDRKKIYRWLTSSGLGAGVIISLSSWGAPSALAQSCAAAPPGITAWWPASGNANDIIANHRGTLNGGVSFTPGVVGEAFSFDGSSGYVQIPSSAALQPPSAISITAWVYPTSFSNVNGNSIAAKYGSGGASWALAAFTESGQIEWEVFDGSTSDSAFVTQASLNVRSWQFVAATFDDATQTWAVYINGTSVPLSCRPGYVCVPVGPIDQNSSPVQIGAYTGGNGIEGFWSGLIDEVQVFRVALTPAQVAAIYNAGSSGVCPPGWKASRRYFKGDEVHDPAKHVQAVVTGGTSGTTKPAWNNAGGTTTDGTVTWKDRGLEP